jgi:4-diphosphocytidyl-2-C-methyl-D-erythritol kinase
MGRAVDIVAPAKVNLYLKIGGRRPDGYHQLISLFQMVSLYDHIRIRSLKTEDAYRLDGDFGFPAEENIITRAVRVFRKNTGARRGVRIQVKKGIPLGAGLGGGSSDAAAVLAGLNQMLETGLDPAALRSLAVELGSDIPFFLTAPAAVVRGRGEIVEPVAARSDYALVLVYPGFPVITGEAYRWLDTYRRDSGGAQQAGQSQDLLEVTDDLKQIYTQARPGEWTLFNSFAPLLKARFPLLEEIITALKKTGAAAAGVSGSGSTIFGLFNLREEARKAARVLKNAYMLVKFVEPLEISPCTGLE